MVGGSAASVCLEASDKAPAAQPTVVSWVTVKQLGGVKAQQQQERSELRLEEEAVVVLEQREATQAAESQAATTISEAGAERRRKEPMGEERSEGSAVARAQRDLAGNAERKQAWTREMAEALALVPLTLVLVAAPEVVEEIGLYASVGWGEVANEQA